ncbi:MAG TPA: hypothetical protein VFY90_11565, partial [Tepidiformaceae bacterium]|nr:hypothetical protein [Tepidiformaceae bacterium]
MKTLRPWALGLLGVLALSAATACSSRDNGGTPATSSTAEPSATATSHAAPSSTPQDLTPGLQKILDDVASVRELDPPPALKVNLIARSELPA